MNDEHASKTAAISINSTTEGLPLAPSMGPTLAANEVPVHSTLLNGQVVRVTAMAGALAVAVAFIAQGLTYLINVVTNVAFFGHLALGPASPSHHTRGWGVVFVPIIGAVAVGMMARFGTPAIRGHGIPEAMEKILFAESRIPLRMTFLKPVSAAVAIGTGGPFGAEGPIIATGGALGSFLGQIVHTSAAERKTLLAAGAAAGMAATFGSPVSALLLAIELLLFEYKPRSFIPVSVAAGLATAVRYAVIGPAPALAMPEPGQPHSLSLAVYACIGLAMGLASVGVTRAVYYIEDVFERLPIHWMWWPAIGAIPLSVVALAYPQVLGVGYENIEAALGGKLALTAAATLAVVKFAVWCISLGSGTSGGTLAPLLTIGGAAGACIGTALAHAFPTLHIEPGMAALVGMAALFAGASRALLASVVFAFESTRQPIALLPLLLGCSFAFLLSSLLMKHSIMTEKMARRGLRVPEHGAV